MPAVPHRVVYIFATLVIAAAWIPFGLVFGLVMLHLFAFGAGIWIITEGRHSKELVCSDCEFYEATDEAIGKCTLVGKVTWPKSALCDDFVLKDQPKVA